MKKIYQTPETIVADMFQETVLAGSQGVKTGSKLGNQVVSNGDCYSKEDNGWDDWEE